MSQEKINPSRGRKRTTDHPPIYPTSAASRSKLSADEWKLYELVVRRFAATLLPAAKMKSISAKIDINGETFTATGSTIVEPNWTRHYPYYKHQDVFVPELGKDQDLKVIDRQLADKETKPPARYSQGKAGPEDGRTGTGYQGYAPQYNTDPYEQGICQGKSPGTFRKGYSPYKDA